MSTDTATAAIRKHADEVAKESACFVCSAPAAPATGRPGCAHDWTTTEARADAADHDRRMTFVYPGGQSTAEAAHVDATRGR